MKTEKWLVKNIDWDVEKNIRGFDKELELVVSNPEDYVTPLPKDFRNVPCLEAMPPALHVYFPDSVLQEYLDFIGGFGESNGIKEEWLRVPREQKEELIWENEQEKEEWIQTEIEYLVYDHLGLAAEWELEFVGIVDRPETASRIEVIN